MFFVIYSSEPLNLLFFLSSIFFIPPFHLRYFDLPPSSLSSSHVKRGEGMGQRGFRNRRRFRKFHSIFFYVSKSSAPGTNAPIFTAITVTVRTRLHTNFPPVESLTIHFSDSPSPLKILPSHTLSAVTKWSQIRRFPGCLGYRSYFSNSEN